MEGCKGLGYQKLNNLRTASRPTVRDLLKTVYQVIIFNLKWT